MRADTVLHDTGRFAVQSGIGTDSSLPQMLRLDCSAYMPL